MPRYKKVIFDLDGTLIDSAPGIHESVKHTLESMNRPCLCDEDLRIFVGAPLYDAFLNIVKMDENEATEAVIIFRNHYSEKSVYIFKIYDGILELIESLFQKGIKLCIASNKPTVLIKKILKYLQIDCFFETVCGSEPSSKETKIEILKKAIAEEKECILIGDRVFDIEAAQHNGIDSIGVLYGYGSQEEFSEADYVCKDVNEIKEILLKQKLATA